MSGEATEEMPAGVFYLGVMVALCALSVAFNAVAVFVVLKFGHARSSIDMLLANLAVSDILHAGVVLPIHFKNASLHDQNFYGGNVVCKLVMFVPLVTVMSTISTIVAIAIERYRAVILRVQSGRKAGFKAIGSIWLVSLMMSSPQLYEYRVYDRLSYGMNTSRISCGSEGIPENFESIYASLVLGIAYIGPLTIISVCYTKIIRFVWIHAKRFRQTRLQAPSAVTQDASQRIGNVVAARTVQVSKMCFCITGTFAVLWAPYFVMFTLTEVSGMDDTAHLADWPHHAGRTMTVLSTVANPVLFLLFNETLRMAFLRVLCRLPPAAPEGQNAHNEDQPTQLSNLAKNQTIASLPWRNNKVHVAVTGETGI